MTYITRRRVSYFYDAEVGNYYYAQGHPMKPHRMRMTHNLLLSYGLLDKMDVLVTPRASQREMTRFHSDEYINFLNSISPDTLPDYTTSLCRFNVLEDCPVFDGLWDYCQIAAGGSLAGAARLNSGDSSIAINWAGGLHHAKRAEASGFCYINDCVLAILELLKVHARVLYVDIDIHHGDGVEEAFYTTDRVMTASFHKYGDYFPGTGSVFDIGIHRGKYYSANFPLRDGIDDESYREIFVPVMSRIMEWYQPGVVVLQCGADSLSGDRLGCFNLSLLGHAQCVDFFKRYDIPLLLLGGGGYTIRNVARCWAYETSRVVGETLSDELPFNENYEFYGPEFRLHLVPSNMENHNSPSELNKTKMQIFEHLRHLPHAPSTPMVETPRNSPYLKIRLDGEGHSAAVDTNNDNDDPDVRKRSRRAKTVVDYAGSDDEEDDQYISSLRYAKRKCKRSNFPRRRFPTAVLRPGMAGSGRPSALDLSEGGDVGLDAAGENPPASRKPDSVKWSGNFSKSLGENGKASPSKDFRSGDIRQATARGQDHSTAEAVGPGGVGRDTDGRAEAKTEISLVDKDDENERRSSDKIPGTTFRPIDGDEGSSSKPGSAKVTKEEVLKRRRAFLRAERSTREARNHWQGPHATEDDQYQMKLCMPNSERQRGQGIPPSKVWNEVYVNKNEKEKTRGLLEVEEDEDDYKYRGRSNQDMWGGSYPRQSGTGAGPSGKASRAAENSDRERNEKIDKHWGASYSRHSGSGAGPSKKASAAGDGSDVDMDIEKRAGGHQESERSNAANDGHEDKTVVKENGRRRSDDDGRPGKGEINRTKKRARDNGKRTGYSREMGQGAFVSGESEGRVGRSIHEEGNPNGARSDKLEIPLGQSSGGPRFRKDSGRSNGYDNDGESEAVMKGRPDGTDGTVDEDDEPIRAGWDGKESRRRDREITVPQDVISGRRRDGRRDGDDVTVIRDRGNDIKDGRGREGAREKWDDGNDADEEDADVGGTRTQRGVGGMRARRAMRTAERSGEESSEEKSDDSRKVRVEQEGRKVGKRRNEDERQSGERRTGGGSEETQEKSNESRREEPSYPQEVEEEEMTPSDEGFGDESWMNVRRRESRATSGDRRDDGDEVGGDGRASRETESGAAGRRDGSAGAERGAAE